jgi:hypothetical protein
MILNEFWGNLEGEHALLIWTMPDKRSHWFMAPSQLDRAYERALDLSERGDDVYFGMGLQPPGLGAAERGYNHTATAIAGLWADIDFAAEGHQKPNLPPSLEAAMALVNDMPLAPTIVVNSGHGLHAYWLFHEPWEFASDQDREEAAWMARLWQTAIKARAKVLGPWDVDSTHDLTRVLRVPGTMNRKGTPVPVSYIVEDGPRHSHDDVEVYLINDDPSLRATVPTVDLGDWRATGMPALKFQALMEHDERFRWSWEHERTDILDQSMSSYDLSLLAIAAGQGWTDGELADLLIAHREKWGDEGKAERYDYIQRTVSVARRRSDVEQRVSAAQAGDDTALTSGNLEDVARARWKQLGVGEMVRWEVVKGDRNEFLLQTPKASVRMDWNTLSLYSSFARLVATHLGCSLVAATQKEWNGQIASLMNMAVVRGESTDVNAGVAALLRDFIENKGVYEGPETGRMDALESNAVRVADGRLAIAPKVLLRYAMTSTGDEFMRLSDLKARILLAGGESGTLAMPKKDGEGRTTRSVWRVPDPGVES